MGRKNVLFSAARAAPRGSSKPVAKKRIGENASWREIGDAQTKARVDAAPTICNARRITFARERTGSKRVLSGYGSGPTVAHIAMMRAMHRGKEKAAPRQGLQGRSVKPLYFRCA
jgi:hypothetical protein